MRALLVRIVLLLILRYVDDYFGCDRPEEAPSVVTRDGRRTFGLWCRQVEHALSCATRLLRAIMGHSILAEK